MLMPAFTIRPVPAQRRLPIVCWRSPTIESIRASALTGAVVEAGERPATGVGAAAGTTGAVVFVRIE